jgi:hypothetical protein
MKTFKNWLKEDGPANGIGSGGGIRGLGNVTGDPGGGISNYAAQNAAAPPAAQALIDQHNAMVNTDAVGGDITDGNIKKGGSK